jgi:hypothetical protein
MQVGGKKQLSITPTQALPHRGGEEVSWCELHCKTLMYTRSVFPGGHRWQVLIPCCRLRRGNMAGTRWLSARQVGRPTGPPSMRVGGPRNMVCACR